MKSILASFSLLAILANANPVEPRQSCPKVHVFGARETTASAGYGTAGGLVNQVLASYSGSTAEAIVYPACGGQASCGGVSYDSSQSQGTTAVVKAVNDFNAKCPSTQLVLVGYSQGGQIMDNAICGGGSAQLSGNALNAVKAAIFMGDPRYVHGLSYNVGTCAAQGFAARPVGFTCVSAAKLKSYCDAPDPYCCTGNDAATHQGYVTKYGSQALAFIKTKVTA
ncbi:acetylxylan esterase precursor [Pseudovirgaria hyperparasitica]|uniref:Acetylxylan esterase n=1 Tax=Pseudovirgaria hyperparasitica TaxID=470096 RepID=A0A6A6W421_9PEZI|nr:acetylxylan esterase precursor [Pseudovirgaria hyperparasitica]KAF2757612.1 acetylxylan esterase precursor [Pseudovirgaria hyperparasitica]